jgi:hypothetical protein
MGSLRFELRSLRPERNRMVQATLRPLGQYAHLLVRVELVNDLFVREEHAPAAVPGNMKIVEDLFGILAFLPPCLEFIPCCGDGFSTGETSNGYHFFNLSSYLLV